MSLAVAVALFGVGLLVGLGAGWLVGRREGYLSGQSDAAWGRRFVDDWHRRV